jgi:uncharacterized membrane protein YqjE
MLDDTSDTRTTLFQSLNRLFRTGVHLVHTRVELLALELAEEGQRWKIVLFLGAVAMVLLHLSLLLVTFLIIAACWETHRLEAIVGCLVVYTGGALGALGYAWYLLKTKPPFLGDTINELQKDRDFVGELKS